MHEHGVVPRQRLLGGPEQGHRQVSIGRQPIRNLGRLQADPPGRSSAIGECSAPLHTQMRHWSNGSRVGTATGLIQKSQEIAAIARRLDVAERSCGQQAWQRIEASGPAARDLQPISPIQEWPQLAARA